MRTRLHTLVASQLLLLLLPGCSSDPVRPIGTEPNDPPPAEWSSATELFTRHGRIAAGDHLYAIGQGGSGSSHFEARRSADEGATWSSPVGTVNGATQQNIYRGFRAVGQTLHLIARDNSNNHLYYHRSNDGGATWQARVQITTAAADATPWRRYALAVVGGGQRLYMADSPAGVHGIPVWRSLDGGATWSRIAEIAHDPPYRWASVPSIAVDATQAEDIVHLSWQQDMHEMNWDSRTGLEHRHSWYRRSNDGGETWGSIVQLSPSDNNRILQGRPDILAIGSQVYAIWQSAEALNTNFSVWFRRSDDRGVTWHDAKEVLAGGVNGFDHPLLAVGPQSSAVHVAAKHHSGDEIAYTRSDDFGGAWIEPESVLTDAEDGADQPFSLAVSDEFVHIMGGKAGRGDGPQPSVYTRRSIP